MHSWALPTSDTHLIIFPDRVSIEVIIEQMNTVTDEYKRGAVDIGCQDATPLMATGNTINNFLGG